MIYGDAVSEEDLKEFISDDTKNFDEATIYAKDKTCSKIADKITKEIAPPVSASLLSSATRHWNAVIKFLTSWQK